MNWVLFCISSIIIGSTEHISIDKYLNSALISCSVANSMIIKLATNLLPITLTSTSSIGFEFGLNERECILVVTTIL